MNINNAFPSSYVKASELNGRRVTVTMDRVEMQEIGGEPKPVLYFKGTPKGLVLNKTNALVIADMYSTETDAWGGKQIVIYPARVEFQGKIVDAIRVHLSTPAEMDTQAPLPPRREAEEMPSGPAIDYAAAKNGTNGTNGHHASARSNGRGVLNDEIPF